MNRLLYAIPGIAFIIFSLACGGGGGSGGVTVSDAGSPAVDTNPSLISADQPGKATISIDLANFSEARSKATAISAVKSVQVILKNAAGESSTVTALQVTSTIYEASVEGLPLNIDLDIEVKAFDKDGILAFSGKSSVKITEASKPVTPTVVMTPMDDGQPNLAPVITAVETDSTKVIVDGQISLKVSASDPDGDEIYYQWSTSESLGTFSDATKPSTVWTAPNVAGVYAMTVKISDSELISKYTFEVRVTDNGQVDPDIVFAPIVVGFNVKWEDKTITLTPNILDSEENIYVTYTNLEDNSIKKMTDILSYSADANKEGGFSSDLKFKVGYLDRENVFTEGVFKLSDHVAPFFTNSGAGGESITIDMKSKTVSGYNPFITMMGKIEDSNIDGANESLSEINFDGPFGAVEFIIEYEAEYSDWTVNIGDSITNNGYAGDSSTQSNCAEIQIKGNTLSMYGSDYTDRTKTLDGHLHLEKVSDIISNSNVVILTVYHNGVEYTGNKKGFYHSPYLFALRSNDDLDGKVNNTIFASFNRVIAYAGRSGKGVKKVTIRPLLRNVATHKGITSSKRSEHGEYVRVGADNSTDPYLGDTAPSAKLPILAIKKTAAAAPAGISFDFYNGWSGGEVKLTAPTFGYNITSRAVANRIIEAEFGKGWEMAEFHDGNFFGGSAWRFWAKGSNLPSDTRFWWWIDDQPANLWSVSKTRTHYMLYEKESLSLNTGTVVKPVSVDDVEPFSGTINIDPSTLQTGIPGGDSAITIEEFTTNRDSVMNADIKFAYNANRLFHATLFQNQSDGVEIAYVKTASFSALSVEDVKKADFTSELIDEAAGASVTILVRLSNGDLYKLGDFVEDAKGVSFKSEKI